MKRGIILTIITVVIIALAGFLGWHLSKNNQSSIEGIIINKIDVESVEARLITTYEEYKSLLNEYNAMGKLTKEDFESFDYLIDYIPYFDGMAIDNINVEIGFEINIEYDLNKEVEETNQLLINFIPLNKGTLSSIKKVNRSYK